MAGKKEEDVDTLKRRGRRRLVGAVALVLLAVIVLPMVFDPEPRRSAPPVSVRVPGEDDQPFTPKVTPKAAEKKPEEKKAEERPAVAEKKAIEEKKAEEKKSEEKPAVAEKKAPEGKAEAAAKAAAAEKARAEAALASGEYIVPVGAFANPETVIAKLAGAKVRYYTEKVPTAKGNVTRVRAGPFTTREEADKALQAIKALGLKPGNVATKS
jgi:DedD protein